MNLKAAGIVLAVLFVGAFIGFMASGLIVQLMAPADHKAIVDSMTVKDTAANFQLTPRLVSAGKVEAGKGLSVMFTKGKQYQQTVWIWERFGDAELVMCIWGPDDTGKVYGVEVARLSWDPFAVEVNGVVKLTIEAVTSTAPAVGYYQFEVTVP